MPDGKAMDLALRLQDAARPWDRDGSRAAIGAWRLTRGAVLARDVGTAAALARVGSALCGDTWATLIETLRRTASGTLRDHTATLGTIRRTTTEQLPERALVVRGGIADGYQTLVTSRSALGAATAADRARLKALARDAAESAQRTQATSDEVWRLPRLAATVKGSPRCVWVACEARDVKISGRIRPLSFQAWLNLFVMPDWNPGDTRIERARSTPATRTYKRKRGKRGKRK